MNYRTERLPWVTFSLIGANALVYVVSLICFFATQGESDDWIFRNLWLVPATVGSHPWMFFTQMFVHAGIFHLAGNMIFLFLFGSCVEDMIGRWRFLSFYLLGGLIGDFVYIAMTPEHFSSDMPMGGASGAIMSCMGMYLLLRHDVNIEFKYFLWLFFVYVRAGEFEIPAWVAIGIYFTLDLIGAILGMISPSHHGGTAFGGHIGGLLGGVALIAIWKWMNKSAAEKEAQLNPIIDTAQLIARTAPVMATSETPTIYLHDGMAQTGPFTLTQVQNMLHHGEISPDAQYWSEGMMEWQGVRDLAAYPLG